jgi:Aldehyde dehydrogenase family
MSVSEVDAAVEAAHRAFTTDWRWRSSDERSRLLPLCADVLEEHADELAEIESLEIDTDLTAADQAAVNHAIARELFRRRKHSTPPLSRAAGPRGRMTGPGPDRRAPSETGAPTYNSAARVPAASSTAAVISSCRGPRTRAVGP